jgi:hypothetical protein
MPIIIQKTTSENFPSKSAVCGNGILEKHLISATWFRRTEWVYSRLRSGIMIHTAIANSEIVGQITALPLETAPVELSGESLWYIPCIWMAHKHAAPMLAHQLLESIIGDVEGKTRGVVILSDDIWMNQTNILESFGFEQTGKLERLSGRFNSILTLKLTEDCPSPSVISRNAPGEKDERLHYFNSPHFPLHVLINYKISKENCFSGCLNRIVKHDCADREIIRRYGISFGLYYKGQEFLKRYLLGTPLKELIDECCEPT